MLFVILGEAEESAAACPCRGPEPLLPLTHKFDNHSAATTRIHTLSTTHHKKSTHQIAKSPTKTQPLTAVCPSQNHVSHATHHYCTIIAPAIASGNSTDWTSSAETEAEPGLTVGYFIPN